MRPGVLIINDEVDLCLLMKTYLLRRNNAVHIAHTMADGFAQLQSYYPSFIFLSTTVADYSFEALQKIRAAAQCAEVRVDSYLLRED